MIYGDDHSPELNEVDVLFFEVGDIVYGTDASQVLRIDRSHPDDLELPDLGPLKRGNRVLVFDTPEGEGHLKVDAIRGVRPVPIMDLRRLPLVAGAAPYAVGVFLDQERPVMLIDLVETLNAQGRH
ncbi:Frizzy aggregation protein FrzB [Vitiosangium sp. GDMCC 1.1324]|uniref:Frizzy aggregation protein FrzB n=1 Tax=Vitiosangium sp. (strain GDMCC 1.1324) TaxID=2138576 RepID=UPI000D33445E|nr:Frizzy aggregation protein FrzB [Vitiosangium sp. GDMCC 1.1324]PTL85360.1 Frizzy aggregation protein FrzB [Vitiosangium sp. GDMCC 1.1324]